MIRSLCWFSVLHGSLALETETRPVKKVVNLLEGMQSNLEKEAKEDEDTHDKMQCWCKTNGDEKAKSIEEAQTKIKALEARMDELTATSSRLATEIAVAEEEVSNNEKALQSAQALREKQLTEFKADFKDLTQSATSVDKALDAIGTNKSSFLQTSRGRMVSRAMTQLKMVLLRHERLLNDAQRSEVEEVLNPRSESEFLQQAPSSIDGVAGVLTGLKDSFEGQLSDLKKQESEDKKAHEGLVKAKSEELQADKKQLEAKKEQKAAADLEKSQSKQDMKDTTAALEADSAVIEEVKAKCAVMDTDYEKRGKLRREEQAAVSQTIQVLTADEARENFGKTFSSSFLQVSSQDSRQTRAAAVLAASGEKLDARLTTLAMSVKLDTFESVKKAIDEMKADLKKQQAAEVKKKDWCVAELQKTKLETQEKSLTEQQKVAELETIQSKTSQLAAEIQSLEDEVAEMNKQTQLAGQNREKENKEFQTVVTEQRQTQLLLQKAMTSLKKFYVKDKEAAPAFIQAKSDEDGEPEFKDYKEQSSFGVLSMLQKLIADAKAMEAEATHAETSAQKDYEAFAKTTTAAIKTKMKEKTTKEKEKGAAESSLVEARQAKDALGTKLDELVTLKRHLHDQCDILMKRFDERQSARSDELESLSQAKAMLEA